MGMYYALEITDVLSDYLTGRGRGGGIRERETRN